MGRIARSTLWRTSPKRCYWCNVELEPLLACRDHFQPRAKVKGTLGRKNLVLACFPCNGEKDESDPGAFQESIWLAERRKLVMSGVVNVRTLPTHGTYRRRQERNKTLASIG